MDGVAATRAIRGELPDTPVLVLTALEEPADLSDCLEAGAAGYVLKDAPAARIVDAVRRVLGGERVLDGGLAARLLVRLIDGGRKSSEGDPRAPPPPKALLGKRVADRRRRALPTPSRRGGWRSCG